jgi:periplasmic protein TonB
MGYQALLFCPDEKTARTVTQVLSELEFSVESCIEPFAAVKKLMGQHFDAVVVDCDNEQNATLLFKSARNSTSNQASLAVAVVEGQAGVAKAFRIGANLVLTKPINIEQAKGTLRVARGLLRKGDPTKPAANVPAAAAKATGKPIAPVKTEAPPAPAVPMAPAPASVAEVPAAPPAPPEFKAASHAAWPAMPVASSTPTELNDDDLLDMGLDDSIASPTPGAIVEPAFGTIASTDSQAAKVLPATAFAAAEAKTFSASMPARQGGGAASAPAPAREIKESHAAEIPVRVPSSAEPMFDRPSEAAKSEPFAYSGAEPAFTFGGANVSEKSGGGGTKIILGVAAAAIVAAGLYVGRGKFQGTKSSQESTQMQAAPAPAAVLQSAKPSANPSVPTLPKTSMPAPSNSLSVASTHPEPAPLKSSPTHDSELSDDVTVRDLSKDPAPSTPTETKTAEAPRVIKGGVTPAVHKPAVADSPAPNVIGIAGDSAAPPPDLVSGGESGPKPVLQTVSVSQGVSQGLLVKKVQPIYPRNALFMRTEGPVELIATISKTGDISRISVVSGDSQLTRAASDAVKQWRYKPYMLNGQPVEIQTHVTINFKLPK